MGQDLKNNEPLRNDWISPYFVLTFHHSKCASQAQSAITAITTNATETAKRGPWTVLNKMTMSPDNDPRAYVSWAPYWWPDCCEDAEERKKVSTKVTDYEKRQKNDSIPVMPFPFSAQAPLVAQEPNSQNSSQSLPNATSDPRKEITTSEQSSCIPRPAGWQDNPSLIWSTCPYIQRDGLRNPDLQNLQGPQNFVEMSKSVLYNAITFGLTRDEVFAQKAVQFIRTFFLDPTTGVRPDIRYGQIIRGPPKGTEGDDSTNNYQVGTFRGLIDWRYILEVVNAIVILRAAGSKSWSTLDAARMSKWASDYLHWLETAEIALKAKKAGNNFSSFYFNQVIALYILLGKVDEASKQVNDYFTGPFMQQIDADGNQPLESKRTRALHYVAFGLEGMIANAKLADNLGLNMWSARTGTGKTIRDAVDYALQSADQLKEDSSVDADTTASAGFKDYAELAPHIAAALAAYGDYPDGRYQKYLKNDTLTMDAEQIRTWRFFNQPCSFYSSPSKGHYVSSQKF
ncbi:hypothetical protein CBS101457_006236 [Exobasidium rhododendri]|nr:hypothetical protein CBS101457_006236 [Exobasidium rhododendri]